MQGVPEKSDWGKKNLEGNSLCRGLGVTPKKNLWAGGWERRSRIIHGVRGKIRGKVRSEGIELIHPEGEGSKAERCFRGGSRLLTDETKHCYNAFGRTPGPVV